MTREQLRADFELETFSSLHQCRSPKDEAEYWKHYALWQEQRQVNPETITNDLDLTLVYQKGYEDGKLHNSIDPDELAGEIWAMLRKRVYSTGYKSFDMIKLTIIQHQNKKR